MRFAGAVPHEALPALYAGADLYLWPAINEAYGMAFLEAQAAGLPVVAGRTGGVPAVVADGVSGLLTPVGDAPAFAAAVARLLDAPAERARLAAAARDRIAAHHDERAAAHALAGRAQDAAMSGVPFAVLRHAATAWNAERRLQGLTDTTLSDAGEAEARRWRLPPPADGWLRMSSPLQRARRTAELLQPSTAVTIDPALREMSFGAWEGHTIAELRVTCRRALPRRRAQGPRLPAARWRIAARRSWRASAAGRQGSPESGAPVVAVSHKAAIRALLALATGWDMTGRPPHKLDWRCVHFFTARADGSVAVDRLNVPSRWCVVSARVFFYVQHLLGIGHLRRAATLARALAAGGFDVLLVSGGAPSPGLALGGARFHQLPPVRAADARLKDLSRLDGTPLDEAFRSARVKTLLDLLRAEAPDILVTEQFPFGRTQLRFELLPLVEAAKALRPRPLIVSSVRDVLRRSASPQRIAETVETFEPFDALLIHADPNLVRFERELPRLGPK